MPEIRRSYIKFTLFSNYSGAGEEKYGAPYARARHSLWAGATYAGKWCLQPDFLQWMPYGVLFYFAPSQLLARTGRTQMGAAIAERSTSQRAKAADRLLEEADTKVTPEG